MITVTFTSHPPPPVTPKQIKPFSLPPSCLHFTLLTLHLHLSLSSQTPLFPDSQQAVIYMQILICDLKKKRSFSSYHKINIAYDLAWLSPFCIRFSSTDWTWPPERAVPAVSNHGLNADGDRKHTGVADGKRDNADFARADPCSEENKERVQGKINTHTLICRWEESVPSYCYGLCSQRSRYKSSRFSYLK